MGLLAAIFRHNANTGYTLPVTSAPLGTAATVPIPPVAWQPTGNHWLSIPCIHPADGAIYALGILHRGARSAVEFAGSPEFLAGRGAPLLRPMLSVGGVTTPIGAGGMSWERAVGWLPTYTCSTGSLVLTGTVFAPFGRDADHPGGVYVIAIENRGTDARVEVRLEGTFGHRQQRVRSVRAFADASRIWRSGDTVVLAGEALPGVAALAISADDGATIATASGEDSGASVPTFTLTRALTVPAGTTTHVAFYFAVAPESDGAEATVMAMRRRGWRALLASTREALRSLEQTTGSAAVDRLVNANLLFAYFYGAGRALDDARFYLVRSRAPWNGRGVTVREWDALAWTVPAVQLADAPLARELILRACEVHGTAPGRGVNYLDGTLFEPGFSVEGAAAYALATERYIRETGDDQIVEELVLADTLYASADDLAHRRNRETPLYETEVLPSGLTAPMPYTLHGNAVAALALDVFRRTLDEETAKTVEDPSAVRAAILRQFAADRDGKPALASAIDLRGGVTREDDPVASALWLPLYDAVERQDSTYRRTVKGIGMSSTNGVPLALAQQCARLVGPDAGSTLAWLRRASLDGGIAAEWVDGDGRAVANGGDAALAGLLAYTAWYAVHALGVTP